MGSRGTRTSGAGRLRADDLAQWEECDHDASSGRVQEAGSCDDGNVRIEGVAAAHRNRCRNGLGVFSKIGDFHSVG